MMKKIMFLTIIMLSIGNYSYSKDYYGKGYTIISEQLPVNDDLSFTVNKNVKARTVEGAMRKLLRGSGWRLAKRKNSDPQIKKLYRQPLPQRKQNINVMPFDEALKWLAGDAWVLVIDPVNKLISFEVINNYQ